MKRTRPADDPIRELCRLCRVGKLFAVEDWCRAGKPIQPSIIHHAYWPAEIAIEKAFTASWKFSRATERRPMHALVCCPVEKREMVELLFSFGADAKAISFHHVMGLGDPDIIEMFVDHVADLVTVLRRPQG